VPAGGIGERARVSPSDPPKQFFTLGGRPLFHGASDAVVAAGCHPVVLVVPASHLDRARDEAPDMNDLEITTGDATRQGSVSNGLALIDTEGVVVHDAARPLAPTELVSSVIAALADADAVIAAVPVDETLKRVDDGSRVIETIDRSVIWRAQTPAAFRVDVLRDAHRRADDEGFTGTDESQLVERYGGTVRIVPGHRDNLKVTFPEDVALAEAMMGVGR
jgi:2-C-methyl-D-erythritol 4-phosphate cytidylyltransferase